MITLTEVKNILNITDTTFDSRISLLIPYVEDELFNGILHRDFVDSDGLDHTPISLKITISKMINFHLPLKANRTDESNKFISSIGDLSFTVYTEADQVNGYPSSLINKNVLRYRKMSVGWELGDSSNIGGYVPTTNILIGTGDNATKIFTYDGTLLINTERVYTGALVAERDVDYTINGSVITFNNAPFAGENITLDGWVK